jgi:hypothetical protein
MTLVSTNDDAVAEGTMTGTTGTPGTPAGEGALQTAPHRGDPDRSGTDLGRYLRVHGIVTRPRLAAAFENAASAPIIEVRGGAGWGKTSACLLYAASRQRRGHLVYTFPHVTLVPSDVGRTSAGTTRLVVIDEAGPEQAPVDGILDALERDPMLQVVVSSRERHLLVDRARDRGVATRRLDVSEHGFDADDLLLLAQARGTSLARGWAQYVAHAIGGWPLVATRFIDRLCDSRLGQGTTFSTLDLLITKAFEDALDELLDDSDMSILTKIALADRVGVNPADPAELMLIERVHKLGLGEWVAR